MAFAASEDSRTHKMKIQSRIIGHMTVAAFTEKPGEQTRAGLRGVDLWSQEVGLKPNGLSLAGGCKESERM